MITTNFTDQSTKPARKSAGGTYYVKALQTQPEMHFREFNISRHR